jgi:hypothetical protein
MLPPCYTSCTVKHFMLLVFVTLVLCSECDSGAAAGFAPVRGVLVDAQRQDQRQGARVRLAVVSFRALGPSQYPATTT